jgi:hypothetical protein
LEYIPRLHIIDEYTAPHAAAMCSYIPRLTEEHRSYVCKGLYSSVGTEEYKNIFVGYV